MANVTAGYAQESASAPDSLTVRVNDLAKQAIRVKDLAARVLERLSTDIEKSVVPPQANEIIKQNQHAVFATENCRQQLDMAEETLNRALHLL